MQERGKVVQDESSSNCGETKLRNKHSWKRSERCTRRKVEKSKSCVHWVRLTSRMVGTGKSAGTLSLMGFEEHPCIMSEGTCRAWRPLWFSPPSGCSVTWTGFARAQESIRKMGSTKIKRPWTDFYLFFLPHCKVNQNTVLDNAKLIVSLWRERSAIILLLVVMGDTEKKPKKT